MVTSAILIDFDNIFHALWNADGDLAYRFAEEPSRWLERLAEGEGAARRWLVARCYLNPSGWAETGNPEQPRLYFSRFRPAWVRAGFEVIDCPAITRQTKNAADIRMVIDSLDVLAAPTRCDEFVIASADADFTPLLYRLRAHDRRIVIISPGFASAGFTAVADHCIGYDDLERLVRPEEAGAAEPATAAAAVAEAFGAFIRTEYEAAEAPLNLARLASSVARAVPAAKASDWLGFGSFTAAIGSLGLPHARVAQPFLWDETRHTPPPERASSAKDCPQEPPPAS